MDGSRTLYLVPLIVLCIMGGLLSVIDFREHRLPNNLVALTSLMLIPSVALSSQPRTTVFFAMGHLLIYFILYVVSRAQLGMGDVKFAGALGLGVGLYTNQLDDLVVTTFLLAGCVAAGLLVTRRASWQTHIAFGPIMTAGAIFTIAMAI